MKSCEYCGKEHDGNYGSGRFCSRECARGFSTKNKRNEINKKVSKKLKGKEPFIKGKIKVNGKFVKVSNLSLQEKNILEKLNKKFFVCQICGKKFEYKFEKKYCSKYCREYANSIRRSLYLLKNGTSNTRTKRNLFSYKFIKNIRCDSKLEECAIIYLVDIFKATKIERFNSILDFWDDNFHRTFNPDFYVKKENKIYIVEVKMLWTNINHNYVKFIPYKKEAIKKFCEKNNFKMLWLDFDYDKKFEDIYKNYK